MYNTDSCCPKIYCEDLIFAPQTWTLTMKYITGNAASIDGCNSSMDSMTLFLFFLL